MMSVKKIALHPHEVPWIDEEKKCTKCGQVKKWTEYVVRHDAKSGLQSWCKACTQGAQKNYRVKYPDRVKGETVARKYQLCANAANKTARKYGVEGTLTGDELEVLMQQANYYCPICLSVKNLRFVHKIPLHAGGANQIGNMEVLCQKCHCRKQWGTLNRAF